MRQPLISEGLVDVLVEQISHEKYNANLYLHIASFLNSKGLSNLAKHFEGQFVEEEGHARIIYDLLVDMGINFPFPSIEGCDMVFGSIGDIAEAYLNREILTTQSLSKIKELAILENPIVEEKMRELILMQLHVMEEATDFLDKAEILDSWQMVSLWDLSLSGG